MDPQFEQIKKVLRRKHLGKGGVHGLAIDEAENSVTVYVDPIADLPQLIRELKEDAGALEVKTVTSARPSI